MQLLFTPDDTGTNRATGYATVPYSSDAENETVVETTKDALSGVFQAAGDKGKTLTGAEESVDAAVEDPVSYRDYLVLEDGEIDFDVDHTREDK